MTPSIFLDLITYACVTGFSPGPNNILLLATTSKFGFKRSLRMMCGIWTGFFSVMLLCALFCNLLYDFIPNIRPVMKYVGAAYILYLAWQTFRRNPAGEGTEKNPAFLTGFLLQFFNIKVILYGLTAFTSFILPYEDRMWILPLYALLLMSAGAGGNLLWSTAGSLLKPIFNKYCKAINIIMALLLVWCALRIIR